jgi:predicted aspartyl protease
MLAVRETRTFPEGLQAETARRDGPGPENEEGVSESSITPPRFALKVLAKWAKGSLTADGWIQEKPCRVTIDTGASVTIARPDIVEGLPEKELSRPYVLQTASGETIPVVKEARVELTIGRRTLRSWVFIAYITDDFILGLDILRDYDSSVDIGHRVL